MKRVGLAVLFLLLAAGQADAQEWGRGYFERLSGPGPFDGFDYSYRLLCFGSAVASPLRILPAKKEPNPFCLDAYFSPYHNTEEDRIERGKITMTRYEGELMWRLPWDWANGSMEVGAGFGVIAFSGDGFDFKHLTLTWRAVVKPLKFTPVSKGNRSHQGDKSGILCVVYSAVIIPKGVAPADFHYPANAFDTDHYLQNRGPRVVVLADLSEVLGIR